MSEWIQSLPHFHASMNACAAICQLLAMSRIHKGDRKGHGNLMVIALLFSALFLVSYLTFHFFGEPRSYEGPFRPLYLSILISHIILAAVVVPVVLRAFWLAIKDRLPEHVRFARWALYIWLYVSVTGVIVYLAVYHLSPSLASD